MYWYWTIFSMQTRLNAHFWILLLSWADTIFPFNLFKTWFSHNHQHYAPFSSIKVNYGNVFSEWLHDKNNLQSYWMVTVVSVIVNGKIYLVSNEESFIVYVTGLRKNDNKSTSEWEWDQFSSELSFTREKKCSASIPISR